MTWNSLLIATSMINFPPRGFSKMVDDDVPGQAADESREPIRIAHLARPHLFENHSKALLVQILHQRSIGNRLADHERHAAAVLADQCVLARSIARPDSFHQLARRKPAHFHPPCIVVRLADECWLSSTKASVAGWTN